jgi:hypothetical protein
MMTATTAMKPLILTALLGLLATPAVAQAPAVATMTQARGAFDVKITPSDHAPDESIQSNLLDKAYHGDLEAAGKGEMLSSGDPTSGNAGYVAMERVTGKLGGKTGSFAIMQSATMSFGVDPQMNVTIVPGSGTGDLSGIYGSMTISITGDKHSYVLSYAFAPLK